MNVENINSKSTNAQKNFIISESPYVFDKDKNGFPALTKENVCRINFIIHHDSNYRPLEENGKDSINTIIKNYGFTNKYKDILKIVKEIDKLNSTRQSSQGPKKKGGGGRESTARYISSIKNFYNRLENSDPALVNEIAKNAIETRYTFSFASKYCTYVSRALFEGKEEEDNYCIYDKIISNILPYYAWIYLHERYIKKKSSTIQSLFAKKNNGDYDGYRKLIDRIRESAMVLSEDEYLISRKDFDHLLWYYFKGKKPNYRMINAIDFVGKECSHLTKQ